MACLWLSLVHGSRLLHIIVALHTYNQCNLNICRFNGSSLMVMNYNKADSYMLDMKHCNKVDNMYFGLGLDTVNTDSLERSRYNLGLPK